MLCSDQMDNQALTNEAFWDEFWTGTRIPPNVDLQTQWQFSLAKLLRDNLPQDPSLKLFEIGCAPGRWLVWFHEELGYQVSGCDTSPKGAQLTRDNLRLNGVDGAIYELDFMSEDLPRHAFDVVTSFGVIEHFQNPTPFIARHLELLKPGGILVLEVPNMAGRLNLQLLNSARMQDLVSVHNLDVMHREFFKSIAEDFNLGIRFLDYVGGFDPGMVVHNHDSLKHGRAAIMYPLWAMERLIRLIPLSRNVLTKLNNAVFSNMLVGIFTCRPNKER